MNASVPEGLSQLLEDFAVAVLREKPSDLVSFAAGYFNDLLKSRSRAVAGGSGSDSVTTVEVDMNADGGMIYRAPSFGRVRLAPLTIPSPP